MGPIKIFDFSIHSFNFLNRWGLFEFSMHGIELYFLMCFKLKIEAISTHFKSMSIQYERIRNQKKKHLLEHTYRAILWIYKYTLEKTKTNEKYKSWHKQNSFFVCVILFEHFYLNGVFFYCALDTNFDMLLTEKKKTQQSLYRIKFSVEIYTPMVNGKNRTRIHTTAMIFQSTTKNKKIVWTDRMNVLMPYEKQSLCTVCIVFTVCIFFNATTTNNIDESEKKQCKAILQTVSLLLFRINSIFCRKTKDFRFFSLSLSFQ